MKSSQSSPKTIDEYIKSFPNEVQDMMQELRKTIKKVVPEAQETIAYGIPTFKLHGNLVHFGGYKSHVGFYPAPSGIEAFSKELVQYKTGKGTLQFPLDKPLPLELIRKVVEFRKEQNLAKKNK